MLFCRTTVANPNRTIDAAVSWDLGGIEARVVPTPGHTPTNLSIFIPMEGVLFSGDCLVGGYLPNLEEGGEKDWLNWLDSLAIIAALSPSVVVPGHGPVLREGEIVMEIKRTRRHLEHAIVGGILPGSQRNQER